jgi:hypothetical protein
MSCDNETCEEVIVPGGDLAFGAEGAFGITGGEIAGQATMTRRIGDAAGRGRRNLERGIKKLLRQGGTTYLGQGRPQSVNHTAFALWPIQW